MIPQQQFEMLRKELAAFDEAREELIKTSRLLNNLAKKAMYHVHRDQLLEADKVLNEADALAKELIATYKEDSKKKIGAVTASLQEWAECKAYYHYSKEGVLLTQEVCDLETEDYLLALADFTGELVRKAVSLSIEKKIDAVKNIRLFIEELYGAFLQFNFRNGELRKKTDSVRWNLQKIEELLVRL